MRDIYKLAALAKLRFGNFTTEQLFDLPLTSTTNRPNLNDIAKGISAQLKQAGEENFVDTAKPDPTKTNLELGLEIIKDVIATIQAKNEAERNKADKRAERARILDAINAAEGRELSSASVADLRKKLAALDE